MKMFVAFSCFVFVCFVDAIHSCEEINDWTHSETLDRSHNVRLDWKVQGDTIYMMVKANTTGWVGVGFSPSGGMKGADIVMGWLKEGKLHLQDRHAFANGRPQIDEQQDYELLGGSETNSMTTICFKRKLNTCDEKDFTITNDTIRVIWAFNIEDPEDDLVTAPKYHKTNRGVKSLYMLTAKSQPPSLTNVKTLDMRMPNVKVPDGFDTVYWCRVFRLPKMNEKHHMIGYKPYILDGHEDLIHHLLVYECNGPNVSEHLDPHLNDEGYHCYTSEMPKVFDKCRQTIVTWTVGSEGIFLPNLVGYPLGDRNGGYTYLMFEMHYNNPSVTKGIIDSSGITIYYTNELRKHDAGVLVTGHAVGPIQIIPPHQDQFSNIAHCSPICTDKKFPEAGIKAFGVMLHSHLIGKSIKLRHFRGDKELPPIANNKYYDFNYQQEQLFQKEFLILPNDTLTTECIYDSSKRNVTTLGGESTKDEMCLSMLMYYPKVDLSWCSSYPNINDLLNIFGINTTELSMQEMLSLYYNRIFSPLSHNWTEAEVLKAKAIYYNNDKVAICLIGDGSSLPMEESSRMVNYPKADPYFPPPDDICLDQTHHSQAPPDQTDSSASKIKQWHFMILLVIIISLFN